MPTTFAGKRIPMFNQIPEAQEVENKIDKLILLVNNLKSVNAELTVQAGVLKQECDHLKGKLNTKDEELNQLNNKIKVLKLARSMQGENTSESGKDVKLKINEIIREIDKCIGLLNK